MPQFRRSRSEMNAAGTKAAGATAPLPGLDMKFVRQRTVAGEADQIFIALKGSPPFNVCGRSLEAADQFAFRLSAQSARWPWTRRVEALPVKACVAATDRRESIAFAVERGSARNGAFVRLTRLG
jgi:hypothetical protein